MPETTCWIDAPGPEEADGELREAYDAVARGAPVPYLYRPYGSRPDLMVIADRFYMALLHDGTRRRLAAWEQELVATCVARLNGCAYAAAHHGANLADLIGDPDRAVAVAAALEAEALDAPVFDARTRAMLAYAAKLTRTPAAMAESDLAPLRAAGLDDGEIFELNQIAADFAYWSRTINGLGIALVDEPVGFGDGAPP